MVNYFNKLDCDKKMTCHVRKSEIPSMSYKLYCIHVHVIVVSKIFDH